jgi:outer membrane protein TolC
VLSLGSGLPAFPEIGFTGDLPTIWNGKVQSMVFSMSQFSYIHAARSGVNAAEMNLKEAHEQVALDTSTAYIELDTVYGDLAAVREQEDLAGRLVEIEQQRAEAGVDPVSDLLQAQLTAKQIKLKRIHLESRAETLASQLAALTGLPAGSIVPDHASIPVIPAVRADETPLTTPGIESAKFIAKSRADAAKADSLRPRMFPEISFGALYNRNTTVFNHNDIYYATKLPTTDFSSGFSIQLPIFSALAHAKAQESAAEALRAKVEVEQARRQNDVAIAQLSGTLRELDTVAEIASLKRQIAAEQLKAVHAQLESGNGSGIGPGATPQLSPKAEQQARINERQNYQDELDSALDLSKARLNLLRALGHMQDWLNELHAK